MHKDLIQSITDKRGVFRAADQHARNERDSISKRLDVGYYLFFALKYGYITDVTLQGLESLHRYRDALEKIIRAYNDRKQSDKDKPVFAEIDHIVDQHHRSGAMWTWDDMIRELGFEDTLDNVRKWYDYYIKGIRT